MGPPRDRLPQRSSDGEVDAFLTAAASAPLERARERGGRLIFAMDATASREPTWDAACEIQGRMFTEAAALGGLEIQLCYYRGFAEFAAMPWLSSAETLLGCMRGVGCAGGTTQITRVLEHAARECARGRVDAVAFVGDCMEEDVDTLCARAGELRLHGTPVFVFQEGLDPAAERAFRAVARVSGGAHCRFDPGSARQLRELLAAVAVFAAGGRRALERHSERSGEATRLLARQLAGS